ncbi:EF-P 5-aminopentanol modification-associated protein YfmH [Sutcliffiella horikoshii]|uniref:Insulinase family protein n=1 Tax=Sutcliffiella horikoshii TaxID=79883 RepID=A0A1Y0CM74_9BACI|nr:pitrilysin family protein [Sutcliffiella horikoshii]ART76403.1 peptidase M16 [Sutcliffiella horikoshii]TYS61666.1 insulinase family protein [Sutcliffiella horikoshii]
MEKIEFKQLEENLYHETLDNGLEVYLLPKSGFHKTYATFTTKYGSIDNKFVPLGEDDFVTVPDGIAHFLEHKLFEKEHGDVFQDFSKQGASANAFTSFTRTAYLFSSTSNVEKNLETLMDFVQAPYFTEKTVEKEKGIIGQEITMYEDNADWRAYFGLIESMFHSHPVKIDIAGTIDSISKITKDSLYTCYETFYHPSNMLLFIVGPMDTSEMMQFIKDNQAKKTFKEKEEIKRQFDEEPTSVNEKKKVLKMNVHTSKCMVGIKESNPTKQGPELLKHELTVNILLDLLFGKSSDHYQKLYDDGLIDETFAYDYTGENGFGFAMLGGDTSEPDKLAERVQSILLQFDPNSIEEQELERIKKKKIGSFLRALNSPEFIANQFTRYAFNNMDLFEVTPQLEKITLEDLKAVAKDFIKEEAFTTCQVVPK